MNYNATCFFAVFAVDEKFCKCDDTDAWHMAYVLSYHERTTFSSE